MLTAYLGPQTDEAALIKFFRKVRPFGPGWRHDSGEGRHFRRRSREPADNIPLALLGWFTGCIMIWSALFAVGNFLYGRTGYATALLAVFRGQPGFWFR